jgi:two-component sensor histidine kinase
VQEHQKLIIGELNHRTQNLFAVVQAVADEILFKGRPTAEAKYAFSTRLQALARAYASMAEAASDGATLAQIVERQMPGFSQRYNIAGCDIVVRPSAAQQFAMIVHELATNALKYGALSIPPGRISIEGRAERRVGNGTFSFLWKESGGPPVSRPTRRGFGSTILLGAARHFGKNVKMEYEPEGVRYELQLSLDAIEAMPTPFPIAGVGEKSA